MDCFTAALAALAVTEKETELTHPPELRRMTKDHSTNPLFCNPVATVSHSDFLARKPRVPLGMFFSEPDACLHAYSIDPESMQLIRETDSRQGFIEQRALCRVPLGQEDLLNAQITHNQALSVHPKFLLMLADGLSFVLIDAYDDGSVSFVTRQVPDPAVVSPRQLLWTGEFFVALCSDGYVRSWPEQEPGFDVHCSDEQFDAIGYIEAAPDAVVAACGERCALDVINLATGKSCATISYAPGAFEMFDAARTIAEDRLKERVLRVWGWVDFAAPEQGGISWVVVTPTVWHQYMINCKQTLHHVYSHACPIAATVNDNHSALLLYRDDEGLLTVDMFGLKRWIGGRPDTKVPVMKHGECKISTWTDGAVSVLLPSGWMQTYYFNGSQLPPQLVPSEDRP